MDLGHRAYLTYKHLLIFCIFVAQSNTFFFLLIINYKPYLAFLYLH